MDDPATDPSPDGAPDVPVADQPEQPPAAAAHTSELMATAIRPDEPMAEAVRKVMYRQYQVLLANEAGCRSGKSVAAVHDMRVATRRLRVAFKLFGDYYKRGVVRDLQQDLRKTGRTLGAVRDLDVFNKTARQYLRSLPPQERGDLDLLLAGWKRQRQAAHRDLVDYLDSARYQRLVEKLGAFLTTPGADVVGAKNAPYPLQVRYVLGSTLWQRYEVVRAYEVVLPHAPPELLHALRIECKYLRYTLEFFQEVLGHGAAPLIRQVIAVQDHLGEIQDAHVASRLLADYLSKAYRQQASGGDAATANLDGVTRYLNFRRAHAQQMATTFPQVWQQIDSVKFRQRLAALVVHL